MRQCDGVHHPRSFLKFYKKCFFRDALATSHRASQPCGTKLHACVLTCKSGIHSDKWGTSSSRDTLPLVTLTRSIRELPQRSRCLDWHKPLCGRKWLERRNLEERFSAASDVAHWEFASPWAAMVPAAALCRYALVGLTRAQSRATAWALCMAVARVGSLDSCWCHRYWKHLAHDLHTNQTNLSSVENQLAGVPPRRW